MKIKHLLLLITLLGVHRTVKAQQIEDVVYLKNNWVLHGTIVKNTNEEITIRTLDRNVFVFKLTEVDHVVKERIDIGINNKIKGLSTLLNLARLQPEIPAS